MTNLTPKLFEDVKYLASKVKTDLKGKGFIVPSKNKDGSVIVGDYSIVRENDGFHIRKNDKEVCGPINLAESAIITANNLALGKQLDHNLLEKDKWFGYKKFDEESSLHGARMCIKRKDPDKADVLLIKAELAKQQKNQYKSSILSVFNQIRRLG
jgi:hypothetical protein